MVKGVFLGVGMATILCGNLKFDPYNNQKKDKKLSYYLTLTLRSVWSLNNPKNSEMKFCENMALIC
jgi:hypothetical protein